MSISRPFKILGIHHVAVGHPDKERLRALWCDVLGLTLASSFVSAQENVSGHIAKVGVEPFAVEIDMLQPLDLDKKPAPHTPPLNHVALWVDRLPEAVAWLTAQGVRFTPGGIRQGADGREIAFIHPKASEDFPIGGEGVMIELVQAPPAVVQAFAAIAAASV